MLTSTIQKEIHSWHLQESEPDLASELEELIQQSNENALNDAFYKTLSFGTAGIRGIMGVGTNRMNVHTVAQAMQGIANWINLQKRNDKKNPSLSAPCVALCRDSRINSEKFERVCAEVFAANGIQVKLYPRIEPVPTLSFAVQALGCAAGIMVTSSHNPRQYNGCMFLARVIFREWPCNFFGFGSLSVPIFVPSFILPRDRASEKRPFSCLSR